MWKKKKVCVGTINEEAKQLLVKVSCHVNSFYIVRENMQDAPKTDGGSFT